MKNYNVCKIKNYIKENNLSKKQFCEKCYISTKTLEKLLNDDDSIGIKTLFRVAKGMNIHLKDIFYR